jgi:hypothetical protein
LDNLVLPNSVTTLVGACFSFCSSLRNVTLSNSLTTLSGAFQFGPLTSITIPATIVNIGRDQFRFCPSLISIIFEGTSNLTSFDSFAFLSGNSQRIEMRFVAASGYNSLNATAKSIVNAASSMTNVIVKYGPPCFLKGTLIQCKKDDHECWRPVESLRKGDLVKTLLHGFLPIDVIGTKVIHNPGDNERSDVRLYKYTPDVVPELFEDLIITGTHSVLVQDLTEVERSETERVLGEIYVTDNHYRLPACVDQRAQPWAKEGDFEIFHFALENYNYYTNYGVFANGLLVESSSKRYIKEISAMKFLE